MTRSLGLALLLLVGCHHGTPTPPPPKSGFACVDDLVGKLELPAMRFVDTIKGTRDASFFAVEYGHPRECPDGCFHSRAVLLFRGCDRMGWIAVRDYDGARDRFEPYHLTSGDAALYADVMWQALSTQHLYFYRDVFLPWMARDPGVPAEVAAKARAELAQ